jgi:hypothetical protein
VPKVRRFASPRELSIKLFNFLTVIVPRLIVKQLGIPIIRGNSETAPIIIGMQAELSPHFVLATYLTAAY